MGIPPGDRRVARLRAPARFQTVSAAIRSGLSLAAVRPDRRKEPHAQLPGPSAPDRAPGHWSSPARAAGRLRPNGSGPRSRWTERLEVSGRRSPWRQPAGPLPGRSSGPAPAEVPVQPGNGSSKVPDRVGHHRRDVFVEVDRALAGPPARGCYGIIRSIGSAAAAS